ncbi:MAG: glycosyltransferase [Acidimicrobiia bacterium]|nr:glycosyltransferase [Acidimicrobiia bacterium]
MTDVQSALDLSADGYVIADRTHHQRVRAIADALLAAGMTGDELTSLGNDETQPLDVRVATRVAASRQRIADGVPPLNVAVVIAMWGEQRRLRPPSDDNPTGEDSLHVKLDQLEWLLGDSPVSWRLYVVDDGDPDDSAAVAAERAALHESGERVTVLRLGDVVPADEGPLAGLASVDDSRKGGAIVYGSATAMADGADAVVMTDADNSVDLAQIGLLIGGFVDGADVVIGDRKSSDSVLVKAEARWGPGIVALRHMQRMVGRQLFDRGLRDTQAAFKLYGRQALEPILAAPSTFGFSFDSDWLYATIASDGVITTVPFAFIDSFAESASITQGPMTTWESLLRGLVAAARARGVDHDVEMARVVDELADAGTLERVVAEVPPELEGIDPRRLGDPEVMSPSAMRSWIESL